MVRYALAAVMAAFCFFGGSAKADIPIKEFMREYIMENKDFSVDDSLPTMYSPAKNKARSDYIDYVVQLNLDACAEFEIDPILMLPLQDIESGFRCWVKGDGKRAHNLTQVREEWHRQRFYYTDKHGNLIRGKKVSEVTYNGRELYLLWNNDIDMVRYSCWLLRRTLDNGGTALKAMKPWTKHNTMWKRYKILSAAFYGHHLSGIKKTEQTIAQGKTAVQGENEIVRPIRQE